MKMINITLTNFFYIWEDVEYANLNINSYYVSYSLNFEV
jgi:hypothetical protein